MKDNFPLSAWMDIHYITQHKSYTSCISHYTRHSANSERISAAPPVGAIFDLLNYYGSRIVNAKSVATKSKLDMIYQSMSATTNIIRFEPCMWYVTS